MIGFRIGDRVAITYGNRVKAASIKDIFIRKEGKSFTTWVCYTVNVNGKTVQNTDRNFIFCSNLVEVAKNEND